MGRILHAFLSKCSAKEVLATVMWMIEQLCGQYQPQTSAPSNIICRCCSVHGHCSDFTLGEGWSAGMQWVETAKVHLLLIS